MCLASPGFNTIVATYCMTESTYCLLPLLPLRKQVFRRDLGGPIRGEASPLSWHTLSCSDTRAPAWKNNVSNSLREQIYAIQLPYLIRLIIKKNLRNVKESQERNKVEW